MSVCLAAILYLSPLCPSVALYYSTLVYSVAIRYNVDPLLIVSIIHTETGGTWKTRSRSKTNDYGLMQVHVSKSTNPSLLGRESVLYDPYVGILYGVKSLVLWKRYHNRTCLDVTIHRHPYWSHYQWGYKVRDLTWSRQILSLHRFLTSSFTQITMVSN